MALSFFFKAERNKMKQINVDLIKTQKHNLNLSTDTICNAINMSINNWYDCLQKEMLPGKKIKPLCELLNIKEDELLMK